MLPILLKIMKRGAVVAKSFSEKIKKDIKTRRVLFLIEEAQAKGLVEWSGDAAKDGSPYWVCTQKLEKFVKFIEEKYKLKHKQK